MKLKTLKEIESKRIKYWEGEYEAIEYFKEALKAEVIKWYKEVFQYGEDSEEFKELFNITEEDLK